MAVQERLRKVREEPLVDSGLPHPYREMAADLKAIRQLLTDLTKKGIPTTTAAGIRIPGMAPAAAPSEYVNVVATGLRKAGILIMAEDIYVEPVDFTTARATPAEFPKLAGIALTIFSNTGTFDLYINQKDANHKITLSPLTYPQTILVDWCNIKTVYIGNTAQAGLSAVIIAWLPTAAPPAPSAVTKAAVTITAGDREQFRRLGDVNRDGVIDDVDIAAIKAAYGSKPGAANWNPDADLNGDGKVDILDMTKASGNYGLTIEAWKTRK